MLRLLLIRHGETDWNLAWRFQGHTDIPLNARGRRQAAALGQRLAGETLTAVYASDLCRAGETAGQIAAPHGLSVHADSRLREASFGAWEGLTYAEIQAHDPAGLEKWNREPEFWGPPGGETLGDLAQRAGDFLDSLRTRHGLDSDATLALVAHGGSLQTLLCLALELPGALRWKFHLGHASLSEIRLYPEGAILNLLNDTHHLDGQDALAPEGKEAS